jgi:hypothetical protein
MECTVVVEPDPRTAKLTDEQKRYLKEVAQHSKMLMDRMLGMADQVQEALYDGRANDAMRLLKAMCEMTKQLPARHNSPDWLNKLIEEAHQRPQAPPSKSVN